MKSCMQTAAGNVTRTGTLARNEREYLSEPEGTYRTPSIKSSVPAIESD